MNVGPGHRLSAILLLGPTGAGKTPLGEALAAENLRRTKCHHFDFGSQLRDIVATGVAPAGLTANDVEFLREVLQTGDLLEDEHFRLAENILRAFIAARQVGVDDLIVLNGLPRHMNQAAHIDRIVDIKTVYELSCTGETVLERICTNAAGDRGQRHDDNPELVRKKLLTYAERTVPLVEHYRRRGATIETIRINPETSIQEILRNLNGPIQPDQEG